MPKESTPINLDEIMRRVEKQTIQLILADKFFGATTMGLDIKPKDGLEMPTSCTDSVNLYYDPKYVSEMEELELRGMIAINTMKNAMLHTFRLSRLEHQDIANEASNLEIACVMNEEIKRNSGNGRQPPYALPKYAKYEAQWDGKSAEEIYNELIKRKGKGKKPGGNPGGGGQNDDPAGGGKGKRPSDFVKPPGVKTEQQMKKHEQDWQRKLIQAKQMGVLPAGMERLLDKILNPIVPWQEKLRHLLTMKNRDNYNWMKPNKGYLSIGLWMPSLDSDCMGPVVIGQDTSGSMSQESIERGRSEAMAILELLRPKKLILSDIDADVHTWQEYEPGDKIHLKCTGGGGSDMRPLFTRIEKEDLKPEVCIVITDLQVCFPDKPPDYPVIWLTEEDTVGPFGETIKMEKQ